MAGDVATTGGAGTGVSPALPDEPVLTAAGATDGNATNAGPADAEATDTGPASAEATDTLPHRSHGR